jgi:hypothetical protein
MRRRDVSAALLIGAGVASAAADPAGTPANGYARTTAEAAAGVSQVALAEPPGHVDRYGHNDVPGSTDMSAAFAAAAAQAAEPGGVPVVVASGARYRIARNLQIPAGAPFVVLAGGIVVDTGMQLRINGSFSAPRTPCFVVAAPGAVAFGKGAVAAVYPEWFGASGATSVNAGPPDSTAAFAAAIAAATENGAGVIAISPVSIGPGCFTVGNVVLPTAATVRGTGRHTTNIFCAPGTRGAWWTDGGNAAKIILEDLALYGNNEPGITAGLQLGHRSVPHGTEGYVNRIWVRDIPNGAGLDVLGNVGLYDTITVQKTALNIRITGSANMARGLICMEGRASGAAVGVWLGGTNVSGLEIEAPDPGTLPLRLDDNVSIQGLWFSFAADTNYDHLWELGPRAQAWAIENVTFYFKGAIRVSGNGRRADGAYFGGNVSGAHGSHDAEGSYFSDTAGQRLQSFTLRLMNANGRLRHAIVDGSGGPTNFATAVRGASPQPTDTPAGGFAAGGMLGGPGQFWLDTADQRAADAIGLASISYNSTGLPLAVAACTQSARLGGVVRNRLLFQITHALTGAPVALDAATIGTGRMLQVSWQGYLAT